MNISPENELGARPDFVIIGAMKAATSTLHEQLAAQPGFFMSTPKEPNFFSDDAKYAQGLNWYQSLFADAPANALRGESSTHYTKQPTYPLACPRLAKHLPNARLIYVIRHPIDRLISHYIHEWTQRVISVPISNALACHPELINYGRYAMQLKPYLEAYGCDRVLLVSNERLRVDPQGELERVCQFLGYAGTPRWVHQADGQNVSANRMRKSFWRDAIVHAPVLSGFRRLVPRTFRDQIKQFWMMKQRPEIPIDRLEQIKAIFDADLKQLGDWLGTELSCDNFKATVTNRPLDWVTPPRSESSASSTLGASQA